MQSDDAPAVLNCCARRSSCRRSSRPSVITWQWPTPNLGARMLRQELEKLADAPEPFPEREEARKLLASLGKS